MKLRFLEIEFIETLFPHPFFSLMTRDVKEKEKEILSFVQPFLGKNFLSSCF